MQFTFRSSFSEQYRAFMAVLLRRRIALVWWVLTSCYGGFLLLGGFSDSPDLVLVCLGAFVLALIPGGSAFAVWSGRRKNRTAIGDINVVLDDDGVKMVHAVAESTLRWAAINRVIETKSFFLFFIAANRAVYVPKRVLSGGDLVSIRDTVAAHMPSPAARG